MIVRIQGKLVELTDEAAPKPGAVTVTVALEPRL